MDNYGKQTIIYIASDTRSGSTLLDILLNTDPSAISIGESKLLYEYYNGILNSKRRGSLCSCGVLVSECPFWSKINKQIEKDYQTNLSELITRLDIDSISKAVDNLSDKRKNELITRNMNIIYQTIFKVFDCNVIIDSSKNYAHLKHCLHVDNNVKVIKIMRDGRGVIHSKKKRNNNNALSASYVWARNNTRIDKILEKLPETNKLEISYEALTQNTNKVLDTLSEFTGLKSLNLDVIPDLELHNIAGSPHKWTRNKFVIREDRSWIDSMSIFDKFIFSIIGGFYQKKKGYKLFSNNGLQKN